MIKRKKENCDKDISLHKGKNKNKTTIGTRKARDIRLNVGDKPLH